MDCKSTKYLAVRTEKGTYSDFNTQHFKYICIQYD